MTAHLHEVRHDLIRYANCWEDADVLCEALAPIQGQRVLSIASAGDNSFSLLSHGPELVVAVDVNRVQLHLVALKQAAIQVLEREDFLRFIGFSPCTDRDALYARVRKALSAEVAAFWDARMHEVRAGLVDQGRFERYFRLFRTMVLPLIHGRSRIEGLFAAKDAAAQERFHDRRWNSLRWRLLFRLFFSRAVMGRLGRDPAFLEQVEVDVARFIHGRASAHLRSTGCQQNPFLSYILRGSFAPTLPHYVRSGVYESVQRHIGRLALFEGYAEQAFQQYGMCSRFNLSNIFEYMDAEVFRDLAEAIACNATPGARLAYWNLMVPRGMSEAHPEHFAPVADLSAALHARDKGFFYRAFHVDTRR